MNRAITERVGADEGLFKAKKSASKRPYLGIVIMAQNRAFDPKKQK
jgi:hypothetical protein